MIQYGGQPMFPLLAAIVAVFGVWTALDLFRRVGAKVGSARAGWLVAAAAAMGLSIWSMHFVAVLGFVPGGPVRYDALLTGLSLAVAIAATGLGFALAVGPLAPARLILAGSVMGLGVCLMHYLAMDALRTRVSLGYDLSTLVVSVMFAVILATSALWAATRAKSVIRRLIAAPILGLAMVGAHYLAMTAVRLGPAISAPESGALQPTILAATIGGGTTLLLFLALIGALFDRRFEAVALREAQRATSQLRAVLENLPLGVSVIDPITGEVRIANAEASRLVGHPLGPNSQYGPLAEDGSLLPREQLTLEKAVRQGRPVGPTVRPYRRGDGTIRQFETQAAPLTDEQGRIVSAIVVFRDVTDEIAADHELREARAARESEARLQQVAEAAPVQLWMSDETGRCIYMNRAQRDFWGVQDPTEFDWLKTLLPEDYARVVEAAAQARIQGKPFNVEARYRRADGEIRVMATTAQPRPTLGGKATGMIGVNVDVTEARRAEARQKLLVNELNHRVKNTLATIQSMVRHTLRNSQPERLEETLTARILALSAAHDVLTRGKWEGADLATIVAWSLSPFAGGPNPRFVAEGPPVRLGPQAALALSMVLHELSTNALKYGSLSNEAGSVEIRWTAPRAADARMSLVWRESGGPPVSPPSRLGFGSRLIQRGLAADLRGAASLRFDPEGLVCEMELMAESNLTDFFAAREYS